MDREPLRELVDRHVADAIERGKGGRGVGRPLAAEMRERGLHFTDKAGRQWNERSYAQMVMRTELADASNMANLAVAEQMASPGVRVRDGGPGDVDEPCLVANGQAWSLQYANAHRLEHPNCRRAFAPLRRTFSGRFDRTGAPSRASLLSRILRPLRLGFRLLTR